MSEFALAGRVRQPAPAMQPDAPTVPRLSVVAARMLPVRFGTCFGWLHPARGPSPSSAGVLLCSPLGQEARHIHRQWRLMADRLADAGHPVLRFDYPETGDSWLAPRADLLEAWIDSISQAAAFLQDHGATALTLLGLRFGATLAAVAQARLAHAGNGAGARTDRLILLAPAISGRSYVRELRAFARLSAGAQPEAAAPDNLVEAGGLTLSAETVAAMAKLDLKAAPPAPGPVLILDPWDTAAGHAFADRLRAGGSQVAEGPFPEYENLLESAHTNFFPEQSFTRIIDWLAATAPKLPALGATTRVPEAVLGVHSWRERPCRFGEQNQLFGMLCEPADDAAGDLVLVICNNGSNPHHGHGRFAVTLARALASEGIASLRLDFSGLGDSAGGSAEERPHLFDAPRDAEIGAAFARLEGHGYRRFVLTGICAGAYHAYHAALADPRVVGLYAVNLPKFRWPVGDDPDLEIRRSLHATSYYVGSFRQKQVWLRLMRGKVDVRTVARTLLQRLGRRAAATIVLPIAARFGHPSGAGFPRRSLAALSQRGTRVHFELSHDDPGVEEMVRCFGADGRKVSRLPGCSIQVCGDLDHAVSDVRSREALRGRMVTFLKQMVGR